MKRALYLLTLLPSFCMGSVQSLYHALDPLSVSKSLAFYELYPETAEGKATLARARRLLGVNVDFPLTQLTEAINRFKATKPLTEAEVVLIENMAAFLPNRNLKGYAAKSEEEVVTLPPCEIDLGKGLLLSQMGEEADQMQVRSYSAMLDLMALQVLGRVSLTSSPEDKIRALNHFIFEESRFRFPPHSLYAKEIDLYTFLPSVMDNHLGVCLGVTALYLACAQRIALPLEIVTPPGHIYLRYNRDGKKINIETTARGVNIPDEHYLGVNLKSLKLRTEKEVIGMTHVNQASIYLHQEKFQKAALAYQKAKPFLKGEAMVSELLGFSLLFIGEKEEGCLLLQEAVSSTESDKMLQEKMAEDYLAGKIDEEGVQAVFMQVDENRDSILKKQKRLQTVVKKWPFFRAGLEQLAVTYLQLNRNKEGLVYLKKYDEIDATNPTIEYYLAALHAEREDFKSAWYYLKRAEKLTEEMRPKALRELRQELVQECPEEV